MSILAMPQQVYYRDGQITRFNQLAVKIEMDMVSNHEYYQWLDDRIADVGSIVRGARIVEKDDARSAPPLNVAVYYDTADYRILPTGSLLRTSCNRITHAFCAFKLGEDEHGVRNDHRYVFAGEEKRLIQEDPISTAAVTVVNTLLRRTDIAHPGSFLRHHLDIDPTELDPAICLEDYRYTFYAWLDGRDALRCSIDRFFVSDLRLPAEQRRRRALSEVELAVYPRIDAATAQDERVPRLIDALSRSLCETFGVNVTAAIKYQRAAAALGIMAIDPASARR